MDLRTFIDPIISLGGMGLIFGAGLAFASQKFAVEVDEKVSAIRAVLPGANCGACGYPGCDGMAKAIAAGEAPVNGCPVGGADVAAKVGSIMGVEADAQDKKVAKVICDGDITKCGEKFKYEGIQNCVAAAAIQGGSKACPYGCLGLGTCVEACQFGAIEIVQGVARIDPEKCTACGKCIEACPKNIIDWVPYKQSVVITCSNKDPGKIVRGICTVGCIGCKICVKNCPTGTIGFENNLAFINYENCTNCFTCVEKCPTKAIEGNLEIKQRLGL